MTNKNPGRISTESSAHLQKPAMNLNTVLPIIRIKNSFSDDYYECVDFITATRAMTCAASRLLRIRDDFLLRISRPFYPFRISKNHIIIVPTFGLNTQVNHDIQSVFVNLIDGMAYGTPPSSPVLARGLTGSLHPQCRNPIRGGLVLPRQTESETNSHHRRRNIHDYTFKEVFYETACCCRVREQPSDPAFHSFAIHHYTSTQNYGGYCDEKVHSNIRGTCPTSDVLSKHCHGAAPVNK